MFAPLRLCALRAECADVERATLDASAKRGQIDALLVDERDERGSCVDVDLVRPGNDHLVGARHTLARREARTRIDDDGAPAEWAGEGAQRLGDVTRADGHEPRRWADRLDEHAPSCLLAQPGASRLVRFPALPDAVSLDDHVARATRQGRGAGERLEEHVDLPAAGQPHRPGQLVLDAVRDDARDLAVEDRVAAFRDVRLHAAARDGPEHSPRARHRQFRAEWARGAAACGDDGCDRDLFACGAPFLRFCENVVHLVSW